MAAVNHERATEAGLMKKMLSLGGLHCSVISLQLAKVLGVPTAGCTVPALGFGRVAGLEAETLSVHNNIISLIKWRDGLREFTVVKLDDC